jgi:hypothetical protein
MRCHPFIKAICCLAGPVAEARLTGVDIFKQPGSVTDIEMAAKALQRLPSPRQRRCRLRARTYALVARNWWAIERLARALIDHRELTYDEAVAALQG